MNSNKFFNPDDDKNFDRLIARIESMKESEINLCFIRDEFMEVEKVQDV